MSGPIGDHGVTIMLARGELDIEADIISDTAPLNGLIADLLAATPGSARCATPPAAGWPPSSTRWPPRPGSACVVNEDAIPVRTEVRGASELLGIDPMYVACEGRLVAVVDGGEADKALAALRAHPLGRARPRSSAHITADPPGLVLLKTAFGGTRIVDLLVGDPLPRIC